LKTIGPKHVTARCLGDYRSAISARCTVCIRVLGFAAADTAALTSEPLKQHENDNDDQNGADQPDAAVDIAIAAEAAAKAAEQKNDENDKKAPPPLSAMPGTSPRWPRGSKRYWRSERHAS
jgi:hypothetical protein